MVSPLPDTGAPARELYAAALEMAGWAESRGCVSAVVCEHHTASDGYLPSPVLMAGAGVYWDGAEAALQEDADAVGLSCLSGAHMVLFPRIVQLLAEKGAGDIPVFGGGIIPAEDVAPLKAAGIAEIFTPGTNTAEIIAWLHRTVDRSSQP